MHVAAVVAAGHGSIAEQLVEAGVVPQIADKIVETAVVENSAPEAATVPVKSNNGNHNKPREQRRPMKMADAFDQLRRDQQKQFQTRVLRELVPGYDAEAAIIVTEREELKKSNAALATNKSRLRILRLVAKRNNVLDGLQVEFRLSLEEIAKELDGVISTRNESVKNPKTYKEELVERQVVKFEDGSETYLKRLYVPMEYFKRV